MPTIFEFKGIDASNSISNINNFAEAIRIINAVKKGETNLQKTEYTYLKELLNNSLVGTSKLLHFVNPKQYAIWDSRVYRYLYNKEKVHSYLVENVDKYQHYLQLLAELTSHEITCRICEKVRDVLKAEEFYCEISDFRALELLMFTYGKPLNSANNELVQG